MSQAVSVQNKWRPLKLGHQIVKYKNQKTRWSSMTFIFYMSMIYVGLTWPGQTWFAEFAWIVGQSRTLSFGQHFYHIVHLSAFARQSLAATGALFLAPSKYRRVSIYSSMDHWECTYRIITLYMNYDRQQHRGSSILDRLSRPFTCFVVSAQSAQFSWCPSYHRYHHGHGRSTRRGTVAMIV